jgi:uncharacterized protein YycO
VRSLVFTRSAPAWLDLPIRAFEGGVAGHVACRIADEVIDSTFWGRGVRSQPYDQWAHGRIIVADIPVDMPAGRAADEWLTRQIGKRYDLTGALGFLAWRDWSTDESWYCSELAAAWLQAGGLAVPATRHARVGVRLVHDIAHALHLGRQSSLPQWDAL